MPVNSTQPRLGLESIPVISSVRYWPSLNRTTANPSSSTQSLFHLVCDAQKPLCANPLTSPILALGPRTWSEYSSKCTPQSYMIPPEIDLLPRHQSPGL